MVDKAIELKSVGGIYGGNIKPTPFLCLILKMLQIQPEKDIIVEFIRNEDFKYVRALGAFYMRLTGNSVDVYKYLEPLYIDYRKMKRMNRNAKYELLHMDELIDEMLHADRLFDITLPRLQKRQVLEENNELEPRVSPLEVDLDEADSSSSESSESEKEEEEENAKKGMTMGKIWQALAFVGVRRRVRQRSCCCRAKTTLDNDSRGIGAVTKGDVAQGKAGG